MQALLMRVAATISCFACTVTITVFLLSVPLQRKVHNQIIFNIAVSEFFSAVGGLLGVSKNGSLQCDIQTFLTNYFPLTSIFWTTVIAYFLLSLLDIPNAHSRQKKIMSQTWLHVFCWGVPLVVTFLPLTTDKFGTFDGKDGWCFLRPGSEYPNWTYEFWTIVAFFGWVYLAIAFYLILIIYVFVNLTKVDYPEPRLKETALKSLRKLVSYPIIILISWGSMTVYILWGSLISPSAPQLQDPAFVLITFTVPLFSGTLTSLAFFTCSSEARYTLIRILCCISLDSEDNSANEMRKRGARLLLAIRKDDGLDSNSDTASHTFNLWHTLTRHFQNRVTPLPLAMPSSQGRMPVSP
jgi:hypothetical protein